MVLWTDRNAKWSHRETTLDMDVRDSTGGISGKPSNILLQHKQVFILTLSLFLF